MDGKPHSGSVRIGPLNPVSLVRSPAVVLTRKAMARLEEMLA